MSGKMLMLLCACTVLAGPAIPEIHAQDAKAPEVYSVTEVVSMFGPAVNQQIYRDGNKAVIDQTSVTDGQTTHTRTLYDLQAHTAISWDATSAAAECGKGTFSGDWGDPFAMSESMRADIAKQNAKEMGTETINGVTAKVFQADSQMGVAKAWVDAKSGFLWKMQITPKGAPAQTMIEVKKVSFAKPAASVFALPAGCADVAKAPMPPTEAERIAAETGTSATDLANAIMGPASKTSCSVLLRVVKAGTMQPVSGFQVAVDRNVDLDHPASYTNGLATNGHITFGGGSIQELTAQVRNGTLRIADAPAQLYIDLGFGNAGESASLIYRQCAGPETVLLFVVKNPAKISDGADWLWVKSGKYAVVK